MPVLTIQSAVAYGHVGNSAAVFALQRQGVEAWPVNTVEFSNHTGYPDWAGQVLAPEHVAAVIGGIARRGVLPRCRAVLSGYVGSAALGEVILGAVARVRAASPAALWLCDTVMGSAGRGFFVAPGIPEFFRDAAVPQADIVVANLFELAWLTGMPVGGPAEVVGAARALLAPPGAVGPRLVVANGLVPEAGQIGSMAVAADAAWMAIAPRVAMEANGAGDTFSALFLGRLLRGGGGLGSPLASPLASPDAVPAALSGAVAGLHGIVAATHAAGLAELDLVGAQEEIVAPRRASPAVPVP